MSHRGVEKLLVVPQFEIRENKKASGPAPMPHDLAISSDSFMADRPGLTSEEVIARNELFHIAK